MVIGIVFETLLLCYKVAEDCLLNIFGIKKKGQFLNYCGAVGGKI